MNKKMCLATSIGLCLLNCLPSMACSIVEDYSYIGNSIIGTSDICTLSTDETFKDNSCYLSSVPNIRKSKEYLISLILLGKLYEFGDGYYIDGIYYKPDYNTIKTMDCPIIDNVSEIINTSKSIIEESK